MEVVAPSGRVLRDETKQIRQMQTNMQMQVVMVRRRRSRAVAAAGGFPVLCVWETESSAKQRRAEQSNTKSDELEDFRKRRDEKSLEIFSQRPTCNARIPSNSDSDTRLEMKKD